MTNELVGISRKSFQDSRSGDWVDMTTLYIVCHDNPQENLEGDMVATYRLMRNRCEGLRLGMVDLQFAPTNDGKAKLSGAVNTQKKAS